MLTNPNTTAAPVRWSAEEMVKREVQLISLPEIYFRARQTLEDPNNGMAELAEVITQDPALTARVLKLANSGLYRFSAPITTVRQAVTLLGTTEVSQLITVTCITRAFSGISNSSMNMDLFWQNSIYCASLSKLFGELQKKGGAEGVFVAGLLHDIGHLIMYQLAPAECAEVMQAAAHEERALDELEQEIVGCHYADIGGVLLANWKLPAYLCEPVRSHLHPSPEAPYAVETAIVHLAARLSRSTATGSPFREEEFFAEEWIWELTRLSPALCGSKLFEAEKLSQEVLGLIFPGHGQLT
ncbi:MAG: HDOD domain-containing protein [Chromatiaceae bacterium]|nr:HDOD domain-containing protein [Chromatiaceae bacterium]